MFWQRLAGGVLPAYMQNKDGLRSPTLEHIRDSTEAQRSPPALPPRKSDEDPFQGEKKDKRVSIGPTTVASEGSKPSEDAVKLTPEEEKHIEEQAARQLQDEISRHSYASKSSGTDTVREVDDEKDEDTEANYDSTKQSPLESPSKDVQRLSLTIPGGFQS